MEYRTKKRKRKVKKLVSILLLFLVIRFAVYLIGSTISLAEVFRFSGQTASAEHGWNLILVNQDYKIPKSWNVELTELANGQSVDSRIYPDLQKMFDDMRAQGVSPVVASGYRTSEKQQALMNDKVETFLSKGYSRADAKAEAKMWVAKVGYSEHQTGLAVDINADGVNSTGEQVYTWLANNAWKYGFILRYPENKVDITKTDYEPWHYRSVGVEAAAKIQEKGLCLEEYISMLK